MAIIVAAIAVAWSLFAAYGAAVPGPSGEWSVLAVYAAYFINVPVAFLALSVAVTVKRGSAVLRRACFIIGLVTLCLPVLVNVLFWLR